jgi:hypothetical protein
MLIEKIDMVSSQPFKGLVYDFLDVFRLTVEATRHFAILNVKAEFAAKSDALPGHVAHPQAPHSQAHSSPAIITPMS